MPGTDVTNPAGVKAICDQLECSPSANDKSSNYGGAPGLDSKNSTSNSGGLKEDTFDAAASGVPGYSGGRAAKAKKA